jgi:hypothetical protein
MSCMPGKPRGIEWIRCNVVMWHDVIWVKMTCQLNTWHDADLTSTTGSVHGGRIRGDGRSYISLYKRWACSPKAGSEEREVGNSDELCYEQS